MPSLKSEGIFTWFIQVNRASKRVMFLWIDSVFE